MKGSLALLCAVIDAAAMLMPNAAWPADPVRIDEDGTAHVPSMVLPESSFLSEQTRAALKKARTRDADGSASQNSCAPIEKADRAQAPAIRRCEADRYYQSAFYKALRDRYPVTLTGGKIAGVYTETFVPMQGIAPDNRARVLVNLHGGGFVGGSRINSHTESVPIASVGRIKVISVDYRQAPEYEFPAASEDVAAVYRELVKTYLPKNIGIYGCSAGGLLTAQSLAWFQKEKLPAPGAVGMLCEGAGYWTEGDTGRVGQALIGSPVIWGPAGNNPYFKHTSLNDPLAFPVRSPAVMARFPPSLLIASTRDPALSSVVHTHSVLVALGVSAELHVWDGLEHAFFFDPDVPESQEVYAVVARYFEGHLGRE